MLKFEKAADFEDVIYETVNAIAPGFYTGTKLGDAEGRTEEET